MNIYLAGASHQATTKWIQDKGYDKLLSYANDKSLIEKWITNVKQNGDTGSKLFIDSGAFTMWTKGAEVDVDKYIQWLNERVNYIYLFGQVDSIPGDIKTGATREQVEEAAQKTWENYLYMRERVINKDGLLYTYHVGEPEKFLKQALEWTDENGEYIKYIALGGMVGKNKPVKENFLRNCFNIIKHSSNPNVKTHAFGMTSLDLLNKYPITSADSTGWLMTAMTGSIFTMYGTVCVSEQTTQNTEIPQTEETNSTYVGEEEKESQNDQAQNETQTKEEKAIELAKKEWGEKDTSVTYTIEQKEGNVYYISVKRGTEVQVWYQVDTDKWTISQY